MEKDLVGFQNLLGLSINIFKQFCHSELDSESAIATPFPYY